MKRSEFYTGVERRVCLDPTLMEFVQIGDKIYDVHEVIQVIESANLTNKNKTKRAPRKQKENNNDIHS